MEPLKKNIDLLVKNTWNLEFKAWEQDLREKRVNFCNAFDTNNPLNGDSFYDLSDRCWGEINGRLAEQYFGVLKEISAISPEIFEKYSNQAIETLDFFSFYAITLGDYRKYSKEYQ